MDFSVCAQCGMEIEDKGIHFRNQVFCSDDCCEAFEEDFSSSGEPGLEDLDEDLDEDFSEDDLGYEEDDDSGDDFLDDDDYEIDPDDF